MSEINYNYNNITPFKWFILENFPFLEDGIDALTNYQLFCKLGEEINKNRDAINSIGENEEILVQAFNPLHDYVQDYFNNLDVQEEINNKLDSMAQDGTLTELIGQYTTPYIEHTNELIEAQNDEIQRIRNQVNLVASGSPLVADSISDMTNTERIYVLTTDGEWYYYDGEEWTSGGVYQTAEISSNSIYPYQLNDSVLHKRDIQENITLGDIVNRRINADGTIGSSTYGYYTKVNCTAGQKIYVNYYMTIGYPIVSFYDSDNTFLSNYISTTQGGKITQNTPDNCNYALVQSSDPANLTLNNIKLYTIDTVVHADDTNFEDIIDTFENIQILATSDTIQLNKTSNSYISRSNGNVYSLNGLYASDYISVPYDSKTVTISSDRDFTSTTPDARGLAFYDVDKNFISGVQYTQTDEIETEVPQGAKYIRLTIRNTAQIINIKYDLTDFLNIGINRTPLNPIINNAGLVNIFDSITCIGDSLTEGELESNNTGSTIYNIYSNMSYPAHLERVTGIDVLNLGYGGSTTKSWVNNHSSEMTDSNKTQAYIIALGTNDIGYNGSFDGTTSDIDLSDYTNNADTSCGNYGKIIQKILELQPKAKIFCCGIPNTRNNTATRTSANTLIKEIVNLFSDNCYFLDFQQYGVPESEVTSWKAKYYLGGHLNCLGYSEFAYMIITYIDYIIKTNYNDFKQIQFIGTDKSYT